MNLGRIAEILGASAPAEPQKSLEIVDLAYDSRQVRAGSLLFCYPGAVTDGHQFAGQAVAAGAVALVCERKLQTVVPQLIVKDARRAMALVAKHFFARPTASLTIAGVTGTNGKTTTVYMLDAIFRAAGEVSGLLSTIERRIGSEIRPAPRGTPEAIDLQRLLGEMVSAGVTRCAMEVTSEGIVQGRTDGTDFDVAVFTNLSQDHLNFHHTMENYYQAKRFLFTHLSRAAAVNIDDEWGRRLASEVDVPLTTFGRGNADVVAEDIQLGAQGSSFRAAGGDLDIDVHISIPGAFNVMNALGAAAAATILGVSPGDIASGLESLTGVPGRFEKVDLGQAFAVIVDYAHTPDGLAEVLAAAREIAPGRVIAVFGCGGDRDAGKRPLMGEAAGRWADLVFATSDNPRSEDPLQILREVEKGLVESPPPLGYEIIVDRSEAIGRAIGEAKDSDVIVIAGKGHETGQEFADRTIDFDDRLVAADALRKMR